MKDTTFEYIRYLIRKNLNEDVPTTNVGSGQIAGTPEAGDLPPVDLRKKKYKNLPLFYKTMYRRSKGVQ
jgi:hypothetical protein